MILAYKEEPRTELIGGRVVMLAAPSVDHAYVTDSIHGIFRNYLRGKPCRTFNSKVSVCLEDGEVYEPDVMVVCDRSKIKKDGVYGAPDLVVEVLSPSTAYYDKGHKMRVYERCGVREYWIVDPFTRSIEQYILKDGRFYLQNLYALFGEDDLKSMSEERRAAAVGEFHCSLFDDLTISVEEIFADVQNW